MKSVVIISASLRSNSVTLGVADTIASYVKQYHADKFSVGHYDLKDYEVPRCDGRQISDYGGDVKLFNKIFTNADGIIFCYPVYGQSFTAVLKDLLDCTNTIYGKPILIVQILATDRSFLALQSITSYLIFGHNALLFPKFLVFNEYELVNGSIPKSMNSRINNTLSDYLEFVNVMKRKSVLKKSLSKQPWSK